MNEITLVGSDVHCKGKELCEATRMEGEQKVEEIGVVCTISKSEKRQEEKNLFSTNHPNSQSQHHNSSDLSI